MPHRRPAVFLDPGALLCDLVRRDDGVLVPVPRRRAVGFLRGVNELGYAAIAVSNEPGLARGALTPRGLARARERLRRALAAEGAVLDGDYVCPHHPDPGPGAVARYARACECRKPAPGLLLRAAAERNLDLQRSFVVTRAAEDVEAGRRAGVETVLVAAAGIAPEVRPAHRVADLGAALALIRRARDAASGV